MALLKIMHLSSKIEIILLMMYYLKFLPHFLLFDFLFLKTVAS